MLTTMLYTHHMHIHTHALYLPFLPPQSYYRLGVALQGLERHEEAMVAFAEGLAIDSKSAPLLSGLTQTMLMSPLKGEDCLLPPFPSSSSLSPSTEATYQSVTHYP